MQVAVVHLGTTLELADIMCDPALALCERTTSPLDIMICTSPGLQRLYPSMYR